MSGLSDSLGGVSAAKKAERRVLVAKAKALHLFRELWDSEISSQRDNARTNGSYNATSGTGYMTTPTESGFELVYNYNDDVLTAKLTGTWNQKTAQARFEECWSPT